MRSTLRLNAAAGILSSAWGALISLAAVPFYLRYLGIEAYGLIGFFATIQALLQLLDLGLSPTISREVARYSAGGKLSGAANLLHSLAAIYWLIAIAITLLIVILSPFIAHSWLHSNSLSDSSLSSAVMLIGLIIGCRWTVSLYLGAVNGAQRLLVSSRIAVASSTAGAIGSIAILAWVSPTIGAFFLWQAAVGLGQAIWARHAAWKILGGAGQARFDVMEVKRIWRFAAGMAAVAVSSIVFTQLDKLLLSSLLDLKHYGQYMLASVVASSLYLIVVPVFNVIYPRFCALVANDAPDRLAALYRVGTQALAAVLFPLAILLALFARDAVFIWTGNAEIATGTAPIIGLLSLGSALHGVMYFPYALQLAYGMTRLPILINTCLTVVIVPLLVILTLHFGANGAASSWLALHIFYLFLGTWLTHRTLLTHLAGKWLLQDLGLPLLIASSVILVGYNALPDGFSSWARLSSAATMALVAIAANVLLLPKLRNLVCPYLLHRPNQQP